MRVAVVWIACVLFVSATALAQGDKSTEVRSARERVARIELAEGEDSVGLATALLDLGVLLDSQAASTEARTVLERALAIREKVLGKEHSATAAALTQLALVLRRQESFAEARALLERSLAIREKLLGPEHADTIASVNDLGVVLTDLGELDGASLLLDRALASGEKSLGPRDPRVATYQSNLGRVRELQGRAKEGRESFERSLEIRERALGRENLDTADSMQRLATPLQLAGEYERARELCEAALAARSKALGADHPQSVASEVGLASVLQAEGRFDDAEAHFDHALAACESKLGADHPTTLSVLQSLGALLCERGRDREARSILQRVFAAEQKVLGGDSPAVAETLRRLAIVLGHLDSDAEAERLFQRAIAICEKAVGSEHAQIAVLADDLATFFEQRERYVEAEPLRERALAITEKLFGADDPRTATQLRALADCLKAQAKLERARPLFERALAIQEKSLGPDHPETCATIEGLGELARDGGNPVIARYLLERAFDSRLRVLGIEHPSTQAVQYELILVLADLGEKDAALAVATKAAHTSDEEMLRSLALFSNSDRLRSVADRRASLELLLDLTRTGPESAERAVYDGVLEWKGRLARSLLEDRDRVLTTSSADELRGVQAELSTEIHRPLIDDRERHDRRIAQLRERRGALERAFVDRVAEQFAPVDVACAHMVRALPPGSVLVDFFIHRVYVPAVLDGVRVAAPGRFSEPRLSAWLSKAGGGRPTRVDLGPAHVVQKCQRAFLESLQSQRGAFEDASARLLEVVWTPLEEAIGDARQVFISPDGFLATLPFGALRKEDGTYLIEAHGFVYVPAPASIAAIASRAPLRASEEDTVLLAVGNIDYDVRGEPADDEEAAPAKAAELPRGSFEEHWDRLRVSGREATVVAERFAAAHPSAAPTVQLRKGHATAPAIQREMPGKRYLHIATHVFFQPEGVPSLWEQAQSQRELRRTPGWMPAHLSGLVCAGANLAPDQSGDDGALDTGELSRIDLSKCELAVLSQCQPAFARQRDGEGVMNLQRALETAGVRCVITSLWRNDDGANVDFARAFYDRLWGEKQSKIDALRGAQLEILAKNKTAHQDAALPYTWGAFVLSGDWR